MFRRVIVRTTVAMTMVMAAIGVGAPAAHGASAPEFWAEYFHSGGATLVVRAQGTIQWYNRSVGFPTVELWVRANYCGRAKFEGYAGNIREPVHVTYSSTLCLDSSGWYEVGPAGPLDGSDIRGGITHIKVYAQKMGDGGFNDVLATGVAYQFNR
jgi:hypothetical protein